MAITSRREFWLVMAIVLVFIAVHAISTGGHVLQTSAFLGYANLTNLGKDIGMLGIFALGAGIVIIAGGIDLSTGSVICFAGMLCAKMPEWIVGMDSVFVDSFGWSLFGLQLHGAAAASHSVVVTILTVVATLLVGLGVGALHALLVVKLDLPPFVVTLGTMAALRSLASLITTGVIELSDERIKSLGANWPMPVGLFLVECFLLAVIMRSTVVGRRLQAMGGNEEAARLSGLSIGRLKLFAYVVGSLTATLAGVVYLAHVGSADSRAGIGYELSGIAAAVIGGCNLKGGSGSIVGILLGVVLLKTVVNGTLYVIPRGSTSWEGLIVGIVVILAVLLGKIGGK